MIPEIIEFFNKYIENQGIIVFSIDLALVLLTIILTLIMYFRRFKAKYVIFTLLVCLILVAVTIILNLQIFKFILLLLLVGIGVMSITYYVTVLRKVTKTTNQNKDSRNNTLTEATKEELIDVLVKTVAHFSSRKIGAIITIEQEKSLNNFINNAVILNAVTTYELLETIFHVNTSLHDGAVIIRGNHIACAGAFFNPSSKTDIPQQYGSRHRAAIGISEESDAFTIVVSEETGTISTTIDGTITSGISIDSLKNALEVNIKVE